MVKTARYAIVTPYYKEPRALLARCVESVRRQTAACDHIVVADGFPQAWLDEQGVRHLRLDAPHGDYGNVARGLGGMLAAGDGYEGIGFLDADNWIDADHAASCGEAGGRAADIVVARRRLMRPDGSTMEIPEEENHIDTNCYWFQPGAYPLIAYWDSMPRELASLADRVFYKLVHERGLRFAAVSHQTVNYTCLYAVCYEMLGEVPPPEAKPPVDPMPVYRWLAGLDPKRQAEVSRLAGVDMVPDARSVLFPFAGMERNATCPCGSGRKFKHCHGALAG